MPAKKTQVAAGLLFASTVHAHPKPHTRGCELSIPPNAANASIPHSNSFASFSFEPAFWVEFFGNASTPNALTFGLLDLIVKHGGRPIIRPGGITMDSMVSFLDIKTGALLTPIQIFDESAEGTAVRTTNEAGGVYRTTVGPAYYHSWDNFPEGTQFVSTLNFGNDSLPIAEGMAVASAKYQGDKILYFELGNEPTNYPSDRWENSTEAYIAQWQNWTNAIDTAVDATGNVDLPKARWWASSATTDITGLKVRPADLIPAGIDSTGEVAEYSIHSYPFSTCDPERQVLATTNNILNHTELLRYAIDEIYPSARASLDSGKPWAIGEFNSISCSGQPNVTDTFAQALWVLDADLIYASLNASSVHLHQGATLVFQSDQQSNEAGEDGSPGFSTYSFVYPRDSIRRDRARALPSFVAQLFMAEAFSTPETRVRALDTPEGVNGERFSAYAFYVNDRLHKLALINMQPYYANSTEDFSVPFSIPSPKGRKHRPHGSVSVKRMTAPHVDEKDTSKSTWAGQSFENGTAVGEVEVEHVGRDGVVNVRGSEAVLVFLDDGEDEAY